MDIASVTNSSQVNLVVPAASDSSSQAENRDLIKTVKGINSSELFGQDSELTFALDQQTRHPVIRIIDRQTQQVIMQLPPEYILQLAQALQTRPDTYVPAEGK